MKTKTFLLSFGFFATTAAFSQSTVTWGYNNSRTDYRDNAGASGIDWQTGNNTMSGFYQSATPIAGTYPPIGVNGWMHLLDVRHDNPANNYAMQFSGSFFDQKLYFRKTDNWAFRPWSRVVLENPSGQVGIGIEEPQAKLHVNGSSIVVGGSTTSGGFTSLTTGISAPNDGYAYLQSIRSSGTAYGNLILNEHGGNVGIGTSDPKTKFQVVGHIAATSSDNLDGFTQLWGDNLIVWKAGNANNGLRFGNATDLSTTNYSQKMIITDAGKVGIGTAAPQELLSVNGNIAAKQVRVTQSGWPDYVFEKNYTLRSLDSVEAFVSTHKHLPDVKSAAKIETDGLDLGENQAALLRKVEELTLYVIELSKTVKQLSSDNTTLKRQIGELKTTKKER
jgi:hypothetical protein